MIDGIRNRPLNQWPFQEPKPEVPPNMAQNLVLTYLHLRSLKFPLTLFLPKEHYPDKMVPFLCGLDKIAICPRDRCAEVQYPAVACTTAAWHSKPDDFLSG